MTENSFGKIADVSPPEMPEYLKRNFCFLPEDGDGEGSIPSPGFMI